MSEQEIHTICNKYKIKNYTINEDMSIDVNGDVSLYDSELEKLPLKFRSVSGYFSCSNNKLKSLEGSPIEIGNWFNCMCNQLTTLEGCPIEVGGYFSCSANQLTSLEGGPQFIGGKFYCSNNPIFEEFLNKFNGDYNLYLKYTKRRKLLNQLIND